MDTLDEALHQALGSFARSVTEKQSGPAAGEPEAQLHGPLLELLGAFGEIAQLRLTVQAESRVGNRIGIPDFAVSRDRLLIGYIELKAPGTGADPERFKGRNRQQWQRFRDLPNLLYTDGNEWALFQNGERVGRVVRLTGDVSTDGASAVEPTDTAAVQELFAKFFAWEVIPPRTAKQLAELLAPICRMLREEVADALKDPNSPLVRLAAEWREHLFPEASDARFADAYAQTVTYALLLAKTEGGDPLDIHHSSEALEAGHTMLARALQVMTDPQAEREIRPALRLVQRMVASVYADTLEAPRGKTDPWLYFYEDFLSAYDPQLRKDAGAYYTPVEIVGAQVRLTDHLLTTRFGMSMGLAEGNGVVILDPAVGTGTYLLGVIDHAMARVSEEEGPGAVRARAALLWQNIHGFEFMVSPYAVAELRLAQAISKYQGKHPTGEPPVYLTNTLESPHTQPPAPPLFYEPIAKEHHRALQVKDRVPIMVCIGNPPYDRHEAGTPENRARTGAWVRWGDDGYGTNALLNDYLQPAREAGHGGHLKNVYNLYVYFWRWAFWKVFEHTNTSRGPGIVSYITASSYLDGDAFVGMREHMRRVCDEIWIIDLGGEGRGTRQSENVFAIQTPVAIAIAVRYARESQRDVPAKVHFTRVEGSRDEKLRRLEAIQSFDDLNWETCPETWQAQFRPAGRGAFFDWPDLADLLPWQHSGVQLKRTWPIAPDSETLNRRWRALMHAEDRATAFKESGDRVISRPYKPLLRNQEWQPSIADMPSDAPTPLVKSYGFRSFDRHKVIVDGRLMSRPRPELWAAHSARQVYFATQLSAPLGRGPALTVSADVPDLHFFSGRGAKDILPLYRDSAAEQPNLPPGLLELLQDCYETDVSAEDWAAYLYSVLAHPAYCDRFADELSHSEIHVPVARQYSVFKTAVAIGRQLIWLHTFGERMVPDGYRVGDLPHGMAKCLVAVSDSPTEFPESFAFDSDREVLSVGDGEFGPVSTTVWEFEVSGLRVVQSWLGYRMKNRTGRKSSPLDEIGPEIWTAAFTTELLRLLWVLELTLNEYPRMEELLDELLSGPLFKASELPDVADELRGSPKSKAGPDLFPE